MCVDDKKAFVFQAWPLSQRPYDKGGSYFAHCLPLACRCQRWFRSVIQRQMPCLYGLYCQYFRRKMSHIWGTHFLWFAFDNKGLYCWCDLGDKCQKMSYYAAFNEGADICNGPCSSNLVYRFCVLVWFCFMVYLFWQYSRLG